MDSENHAYRGIKERVVAAVLRMRFLTLALLNAQQAIQFPSYLPASTYVGFEPLGRVVIDLRATGCVRVVEGFADC